MCALEHNEWFTRYKSTGDSIVTLWEFSFDNLSEAEAFRLDRHIRAIAAGLRDALEQKLKEESNPPNNSYDQGYGDALRWVIERMDNE